MRYTRFLVLTADYAPYNWSGVGVAVAHQALALAKLGCDVQVLTPYSPSANGKVRVHTLSRDHFPLVPRPGDIVHLHSLSLADLAIELAERFSLPLIYTAHSLLHLELRQAERCGNWIWTQERVFCAADHVFFLSKSELENALRVAPYLSPRSSILPNGVPEPPPLRARTPLSGPTVFAGRLTRNKGIDIAVNLFEGLLDSGLSNSLVIAGGHGEREEFNLVMKLTERKCRFAGWLRPAEIEQLFSEASLVVMPSRYEPFGLVALEAMRVGTPVIGSSVGGLRDLLGPGSGGIAVNGFNASKWLHTCQQVLMDPTCWTRLSNQGPPYVASRFTSDAVAKHFLNVIGHL